MQDTRNNKSLPNGIFAVHIADLQPIYAFRAIPLTQDLQVRTHCDCLERISIQFLPTDTNWKGGKLDKNLFILDLGQITIQFHPLTAAFYSYLVLQVILIGCHGTTSVLICVYWHKSRSETCQKLNFPENFSMEHNILFLICYFSALRELAASFLVTDILF